jgi:hypothetical protein
MRSTDVECILLFLPSHAPVGRSSAWRLSSAAGRYSSARVSVVHMLSGAFRRPQPRYERAVSRRRRRSVAGTYNAGERPNPPPDLKVQHVTPPFGEGSSTNRARAAPAAPSRRLGSVAGSSWWSSTHRVWHVLLFQGRGRRTRTMCRSAPVYGIEALVQAPVLTLVRLRDSATGFRQPVRARGQWPKRRLGNGAAAS